MSSTLPPAPSEEGVDPLSSAREFWRLGRLEEAAQAFRACLARAPDHAELGLGRIARRNGDRDQALWHFGRVSPGRLRFEADLEVAAVFLEADRLDEAAQAYAALCDIRPDNIPALVGLARVARRRGDHEQAYLRFKFASDQRSDAAWLLVELATEAQSLGRYDEAERLCERAIAIDASSAPAVRRLGQLARARGDRATAVRHFTRLADLLPTEPGPLLEASHDVIELGDLDRAESLAQSALARRPGFVPALTRLARIERARGARGKARDLFLQAARASSGDPGPFLEAAQDCIALDEWDEAAGCCRMALETRPDHAPALRRLGNIERRRGDHAAGLMLLERAATLLPDDTGLRLDLADALIAVHRDEEALVLCRSVPPGDAAYPRAASAAALVWRRRGALDEALRVLGAALDAHPCDAGLRLQLARMLLAAGRTDQAEEEARKLRSDCPDDARGAVLCAEIARAQGRFDEARAILEDADSRWSGRLEILRPLVADLRTLRAWDAALERIASFSDSKAARRAARVEAARTLEAKGEPDRAIQTLRAGLKADPGDAEARHLLIDILMRRERFLECAEVMADAISLHPSDPLSWAAAARLVVAIDDPAAAIPYASRSCSLAPTRLSSCCELIRLRFLAGEHDAALSDLLQVQEQFPHEPQPFVLRCQLLKSAGFGADAAQAAAVAVRRFPHNIALRRAAAIYGLEVGADLDLDTIDMHGEGTVEADLALLVRVHKAASRFAFEEIVSELEGRAGDVALPRELRVWLATASLLTFDLNKAEQALDALAASFPDGVRQRRRTGLIGDLCEEFAFDGAATLASREALFASDDALGECVAAVVREFPHSTAAALALFIGLRRAGQLGPAEPSASRPIPMQVVQYWDQAILPGDVARLCDSWRQLNGDWQYVRFDDARARAYLASRYMPEVGAAYALARHPAMKADVFRLAYLLAEGGVYADADDRCLAPLDQWLDPTASLTVIQEHLGSLGNNFIAVAPGHPAIRVSLAGAIDAVLTNAAESVWLSTGPGLLTRSAAAWLSDGSARLADRLKSVSVLPLEQARRFVGIGCRAAYKSSPRHWSFERRVRSDQVTRLIEPLLLET